MTTALPTKRHKWTKDELAHLNRSASHAKNKSEVFKKIADEMGVSWTSVRSTYFNHNKPGKPKAKAATKKAPIFTKPKAIPATSFSHLTEDELHGLIKQVKSEIDRRAQTIKDLQALYSR